MNYRKKAIFTILFAIVMTFSYLPSKSQAACTMVQKSDSYPIGWAAYSAIGLSNPGYFLNQTIQAIDPVNIVSTGISFVYQTLPGNQMFINNWAVNGAPAETEFRELPEIPDQPSWNEVYFSTYNATVRPNTYLSTVYAGLDPRSFTWSLALHKEDHLGADPEKVTRAFAWWDMFKPHTIIPPQTGTRFNLTYNKCAAPTPQLVSPGNGTNINNTSVTFQWKMLGGGDYPTSATFEYSFNNSTFYPITITYGDLSLPNMTYTVTVPIPGWPNIITGKQYGGVL